MLSGGYATRLRPISYALPKLLFPVLGRPMIYWTLDLLKTVGTDEVVLGVNYMAEMLRNKVGSTYDEMKITYSLEDHELGTAGPIKLASTNTQLNETFIAMNGDVIAQLDLKEMLKQHKQTGARVTDAVHEVRAPQRFGVVQRGSNGRIQRFVEKPKRGTEPSHLVNAGIYVIEPDVLQLIRPDRKVSLEREIFPILAKEGKLFGFTFSGHWFDIGNLTDYRKANFSLLRDSTEKLEKRRREKNVAADATVQRTVSLGDNARVGSKARIGPYALVGDNSSVDARARIEYSILFENVSIGEGSKVSGSILGTGVRIGKDVKIGRGCIISPYVTVADRVRIGNEAIIHPHKEINKNIRGPAHIM